MPPPKSDTIDGYIRTFRPEVQAILQRLRETIHAAAPGGTEAIKYGMPTIRLGNTYVIYFAAWKKHVGLYPVATGTAALEKALAPYRAKTDTVQFLYSQPIPYDLVTRIVKARLKALATRAP